MGLRQLRRRSLWYTRIKDDYRMVNDQIDTSYQLHEESEGVRR